MVAINEEYQIHVFIVINHMYMCNTVSEFVANVNWWAGEPKIEAP